MAAPKHDDMFSGRYHRRDPWLQKLGYFKKYSLMSLLVAILIGLVQMYILGRLWAYVSIFTPLPHLLLAVGLRGTALYAAVFLSDLLVNVLFCLPAAYAICKLKPPLMFLYLVLAVVP